MKKPLALLLLTIAPLLGNDRAGELAPPVRVEAGGKPIDIEIGHAAPFVGDFDGDGDLDLLVGDYATQLPNLPEPTEEQKAEHERVRKELEPVQARYHELVDLLYGSGKKPSKEELEELEEEFEQVHTSMTELRVKLPPESESHGWVWLFRRESPTK